MIIAMWKGTRPCDKNVVLKQHLYSDGSIHFEFRDRLDHISNPTLIEAEEIIRTWKLGSKM